MSPEDGIDWPTLKTLAGMSDEIGVLSLYTTADPNAETGQPAWQKRVRNQLRQLPEQVKAERSRDDWLAVKSRLEELSAELDQMLDSRMPGRGRALFAPMSNTRNAEIVSVQVPLTDHVALAPKAQLRPLLSAWSHAAPAGAIAVSSQEIRIVDMRLGRAEDVATIPHPEDTADRRDMTGPAHSNPSMAQSMVSLNDVYDRREEYRLHRYLHSMGPAVAQFATDRGWDVVAITGGVSQAQALASGFPHGFQPEVVVLPHPVSNSATPSKLAALVSPAVAESRNERAQRLASHARNAAMAAKPGLGAIGLQPTLAALQQGQVAHLLLAQDASWTGLRAPDGTLIAARGAGSNGLIPEPHLDELMIELAFRDGAAISVLDQRAAEALGDEGIGAILRWSAA